MDYKNGDTEFHLSEKQATKANGRTYFLANVLAQFQKLLWQDYDRISFLPIIPEKEPPDVNEGNCESYLSQAITCVSLRQ